MKRKIIKIDEEKCNGCGLCIDICAEAALKIVDGKAKLTNDFYCDGLGACLDVCPVEALKIVEEDTIEYDPQKTYQHVKDSRGGEAAEKVHGLEKIKDKEESLACDCPGGMMQDFHQDSSDNQEKESKEIDLKSELKQWPIQMHLISPLAPYFEKADLVIVADCVPFSYPNFHQKFLKDKALMIMCPKLDEGQDEYLEKLTEIFKTQNIKSVLVVRMEVPCCGVGSLVTEALEKAGKDIEIKEQVISIQGEVMGE